MNSAIEVRTAKNAAAPAIWKEAARKQEVGLPAEYLSSAQGRVRLSTTGSWQL